MKKMLFIYNPNSGMGLLKAQLSDVLDIFVKSGYEVTVYPTQKYHDALAKTLSYTEEYDLLVCSGGDGTLDEVVTGMSMRSKKIPIGYIPAGSTNDFANSLEIPRDMVEAARGILEGKLCSFDIGDFNHDTCVYVAAFGLFTDVSYQTSQNLKNILGHLAYVMEGAKRIFDVRTYHMKVEANDNTYEGDYLYGMITNTNSVGGFKNLTGTDVELNDGLFEVTLIKQPRNARELNEIIASLLNAIDNTDMIDAFKTDRLRIEADEEIAWTLDGEFGGNHREVVIKNKKQAMDILINS